MVVGDGSPPTISRSAPRHSPGQRYGRTRVKRPTAKFCEARPGVARYLADVGSQVAISGKAKMTPIKMAWATAKGKTPA